MKLTTKIKHLKKALAAVVAETEGNFSRQESFALADELDAMLCYTSVDIEKNLLEPLFKVDIARITKESGERLINAYPAGFHRSELRSYYNANIKDK